MRVHLLAAAACCHLGNTRAFSSKPIGRLDVATDKFKCTLQLQSSRDANNQSMDTVASTRAIVSRLEDDNIAFPVTVRHQGHVATIQVRQNEPILQALERQSSSSSSINSKNDDATITSLGLSSIPHECRRGNCLTCAARLTSPPSPSSSEESVNAISNIQPNVNTGLTPAIERELTSHNFILTCCSYITGPGVTLELEQNELAWNRVYKERVIDNIDVLGMEARANFWVDEKNVGRWRKRMEKLFDGEGLL